MANWNPTITIPLTKLLPPQLAEETLDRARLVRDIHQAATTKRLTLLAAPAGAGKTTAVIALHATHPNLPLAWAALDGGDDDPHIFLQLFIAAVQQHVSGYGHQVQQILETSDENAAPWLRLMGILVNEMVAHISTPFIIVLDDLHRVSDSTIHKLLDYLLERMPPNIHLLITTRHDPPLRLAQLRVRGQLAEFRLETLRFSKAEITSLFNEVMQLGLTAADLQLVHERTEGWAAGVRLLTLSLPRLDSAGKRTDLIQHLSASHRFLFDYLIEEVLNQLEASDRNFLLQTTILDELTPTLCNAVTQRSDAATMLDALYRQNLFLVVSESADPLTEPTYHYHDLFADFLRQRLKLEYAWEAIQTLHCRAAEAATAPVQKVQHYLAAQLWDDATHLITEVGRQQLQQGFIQLPAHWLETLPDFVRAEQPWLQLFSASDQVQKGRMAEAQPLLEKLLPLFSTADDLSGEIYTLARLGQAYMAQGSIDQAALVAEQLLQIARTPFEQVSGYLIKLWASYYQTQWAYVDHATSQVLHIVLNSGDRGAAQMSAQGISPELLYGEIGIDRFEQYCQYNLARFGSESGIIETGMQMMLGGIYLLRGNLEAAQQAASRAKDISLQFGGLGWADAATDMVLLMIAVARGDYHKIEQHVQEALHLMTQDATRQWYLGYYYYAWARALWLQDRLTEVKQVHRQMKSPLIGERAEMALPRAVIESLIDRSEGRYTEAEKTLRAVTPLQQALRHSMLTGHPRLELASLYLAWGRPDEALGELRPLLADLARREMPGVILAEGRSMIPVLELAVKEGVQPDFARQILATWAEQQKPRSIIVPTTGETLTPREVEVLRLITGGASNRAIAEVLVITERTVKSHVTKILAKLDASSRTEAAARAGELRLL